MRLIAVISASALAPNINPDPRFRILNSSLVASDFHHDFISAITVEVQLVNEAVTLPIHAVRNLFGVCISASSTAVVTE